MSRQKQIKRLCCGHTSKLSSGYSPELVAVNKVMDVIEAQIDRVQDASKHDKFHKRR
ncbi:MAG: hypothetical protein U0930_04905 [Pirellulales bacterium]